jgi:C1A family cysteine protease
MRSVLIAIALIALFAVAMAETEDVKKAFEAHKAKYNLNFEPSENSKRLAAFEKSLGDIKRLNAQKNGATFGVGPLAHLTDDEFTALLGTKPPGHQGKTKRALLEEQDVETLPSSKDWRKASKITSVKNQGSCGSCWAFASAAAIESTWAIRGHSLANASPQHLVDCATGSNGCNGGTAMAAFDYVRKNGGIHSWSSYPYKGYRGTCRKFTTSISAKITGSTLMPAKSYSTMMNWVAYKGPIVVALDASYWRHYTGGVLASGSRDPMRVNHSVLVIGYGKTLSGVPYWIVKNSWGTGWGISGYIKVRRSSTTNYMALMSWPQVPII